MINPKIFRAYDIRGKYSSEINESVIKEIIEKFIDFKLKANSYKIKVIIVGHDARLSSHSLYKTVLNQLKTNSYKIKVIPVGLITTPMISFLADKFKSDLNIMITASHNPKEYNGIKIIGKNEAPISGKEILKVIKHKS